MKKFGVKRAFFFHYNKPASQQRGCPILTVHYKGACHLVKAIKCNVPVETRVRKQQPRCVMAGRGTLTIENETAMIN